MCGIYAEVSSRKSGFPASLATAASALQRRGPDETWVCSVPPVRVAMTRLALVATHVSLPALNTDGEAILVLLNGEIWNYRSLASRLGLPECDLNEINVIRAAYARFGVHYPDVLDGMFAIVVVDQARRRVLASRDRFGIKPLFYQLNENGLALASDVRTLSVMTGNFRLNHEYILNRRVFGFSDYHDSVIGSVRQVPPSSSLQFEFPGSAEQLAAVQVPIATSSTKLSTDLPALWAELLDATQKCLTHRDMDPDAKPIVLVSGGVDSTLLCACIAELGLQDHVEGFFVGPVDSDDEQSARTVAEYFSLTLELLRPDLTPEFDGLDSVAVDLGAHFALGLHSLFRQMRASRAGAKIVICGEGADEIFAGYPWHDSALTHLRGIASRLNAERFPPTRLMASLLSRLQDILHDSDEAAARELVLELDRTYCLVERHLLPMDHAAMAFGFEVRLPYLESNLMSRVGQAVAENAAGFSHKKPLRDLLQARAPQLAKSIVGRTKVGFPHAFRAELQRGAAGRHRDGIGALLDFTYPSGIPLWYHLFSARLEQLTGA